jgi:hypothetical protein
LNCGVFWRCSEVGGGGGYEEPLKAQFDDLKFKQVKSFFYEKIN